MDFWFVSVLVLSVLSVFSHACHFSLMKSSAQVALAPVFGCVPGFGTS
jgi:hypothetical protein